MGKRNTKAAGTIHCAGAPTPIEEVVPNPRNPNTHTEDQLERLAKVLKWQGWRNPIVVSKESGFVVAGHGRLQAAQIAGFTQVPVTVQSFESPAQEHAHLVADNRLAELSEWDAPKLKDLIQEIDTGEIDLEQTGYSEREVGSLMSQVFQGDDLGLDPDGKLDVFRNSSVRQIVLVFPEAEFEEIMALVENIRVNGGHDSNTDAIEAAIRAHG